jgi:hypothetical protein
VKPPLVLRQAALAGIALAAALGAIALGRADDGAEPAAEQTTPATSATPTTVQWEEARVGVFGRGRLSEQTACDVTLAAETVGVAHPVLPCGVALVLEHDGREVRTEVIERRAVRTGRAFEVTRALAEALGIRGETQIRWRFAS